MIIRLILALSVAATTVVGIVTDYPFLNSVLLLAGVFVGSFLALALVAVGFLAICCATVDYDKPQEKDSPFFRWLAEQYIVVLIMLLQIRFDTQGLEKIPKEGRFMLVCNHMFDADPAVLLHFFREKQVSFVSKWENRKLPFVGRIMHKLRCPLINREDNRQGLRTIVECINMIRQDEASIAVFPEGYCNSDDRLLPFRPGVFKIATKTNVPIVVCTLQNTRHVVKNGLKLKPTTIRLHLVDVIEPEEYAGMKTTEISDKVFAMMIDDLGPDYAPLK